MTNITKNRSGIGSQFMALKTSMISNGTGQLFSAYFYWECDIRPMLLGRSYRVLIVCGMDLVPRAFVLDPHLKTLAKGKSIPHLYNQEKGHLCLYYPAHYEWKPSMSIANDFVPWIYSWLMFFEQWLATGQWYGGGVHIDRAQSVKSKQQQQRKNIKVSTRRINVFRQKAYDVYSKRLRQYRKENDVTNQYPAES